MVRNVASLADLFDYRARRFAERCTTCGECLEVCPIFPLTKFASSGPRVAMEKLTDLLSGGEVSDEAYELVFSCNGACGICANACPEGLVLYAAFIPAMAKIAASGRDFPPKIYQHTHGHRYHFPDFFSALQLKPSQERWLRRAPVDPQPVDVVFFGGCGATGIPSLLLEATAILDRMGLNFAALSAQELCCGAGPMLYGDPQAAEDIGRRLVANIATFRPKKAIFFCTSCQVMFKWTLSRFMEVPFETCELSEFLSENIDSIPFQKRVDKVVTVHDSCTMASTGSFESVRNLLRAIPGVSLVEMPHNRQNNLCCGGFATSMRPEVVTAERRAPLDEAHSTGAEVMALTCTGCQKSFAPFVHQYPFEIRNYISLVAEGLGVNQENRFMEYMASGDVDQVLAEARDCIGASQYSLDEVRNTLADYLETYRIRD